MKLGRFTLGYVATTTIAAAAGFLFLKWIAGRWPRIPVVGAVARSI